MSRNDGEAGTSSSRPEMINWQTDGYVPTLLNQHNFSPSHSYVDFGVPLGAFTPTPPPFMPQDDSMFNNLFGGNPSQVEPSRFSNVTPIGLNLFDYESHTRSDMTLTRGDMAPRRGGRVRNPTLCGTGSTLGRHDDDEEEE